MGRLPWTQCLKQPRTLRLVSILGLKKNTWKCHQWKSQNCYWNQVVPLPERGLKVGEAARPKDNEGLLCCISKFIKLYSVKITISLLNYIFTAVFTGFLWRAQCKSLPTSWWNRLMDTALALFHHICLNSWKLSIASLSPYPYFRVVNQGNS